MNSRRRPQAKMKLRPAANIHARQRVLVMPELLCVTVSGVVQALAGMGGIQGFPARASRMAVKTAIPCLAAVEA